MAVPRVPRASPPPSGVSSAPLIGPFALRLRGNYLAIITLGLVFLGQHVFENWDSVTGGLNGTPVDAPPIVGPVNFANLTVFGHTFTRDQGYFYLIWILVAVVALTAKNLTRSRAGRAMQAVRDRDAAAEAIGIRLARTKVLAFVVSSSLAAMAGALFGSYQQFVSPSDFRLFVSLQYIAMIVVGGVGTTFGPDPRRPLHHGHAPRDRGVQRPASRALPLSPGPRASPSSH